MVILSRRNTKFDNESILKLIDLVDESENVYEILRNIFDHSSHISNEIGSKVEMMLTLNNSNIQYVLDVLMIITQKGYCTKFGKIPFDKILQTSLKNIDIKTENRKINESVMQILCNNVKNNGILSKEASWLVDISNTTELIENSMNKHD